MSENTEHPKEVTGAAILMAKALLALKPLARIADAYDSNELDDEARKFWGLNNEHANERDPSNIELFSGRGGSELLTLSHCLKAREVLREIEEAE